VPVRVLVGGRSGEDSMTGHEARPSVGEVTLRDVTKGDLSVLFKHQLDPEANRMAAFPARSRDAFMVHRERILDDETVTTKTVLVDGKVAGSVVSFEQDGKLEVGYWLGRGYWDKGIATAALSAFVELVRVRPLYAHVAKHNVASIRVLEKCGFEISGEENGPSDVPGEEAEGLILALRAESGQAR
jgi:RimJ/RimL family protein N-acetyltransferase